MQKEGRLHKMLDSVKAKLILPIAGLILLSGCYSVVNVERMGARKVPHVYLRDSDRDGVPDIYDSRPFTYDFPIRVGPYHPYPFWPGYQFSPKVKKYIKPPVKVKIKTKERTSDTNKLRNNNGERSSKGRR
ncbi:MAG: hypothetical protein NUV46_00165 [Nanoarchaeota archaeon]|nr:hypothetical protein [Nanoarchaeota archaeon]